VVGERGPLANVLEELADEDLVPDAAEGALDHPVGATGGERCTRDVTHVMRLGQVPSPDVPVVGGVLARVDSPPAARERQLRLREHVREARERPYLLARHRARDRLHVALPAHPLRGEVSIERANGLLVDRERAAVHRRGGRGRQDGACPLELQGAGHERAHLKILRIPRRVENADGASAGQRAQPRGESCDHPRRIGPEEKARRARESGQAEGFVVAAGAVGVDLARLPGPVLAEEQVHPHQGGIVPGCPRGRREEQRVVIEAVEGSLARVGVGEVRDATHGADDLLGRAHRCAVQRVREQERRDLHAPLPSDERVPHEEPLCEVAGERRLLQRIDARDGHHLDSRTRHGRSAWRARARPRRRLSK
jgi:hypothetical protein